jgi:hypothetical protein
MTLAELGQAWNDLRNAALGRSVTPLVPAALATKVGNAYERWLNFYSFAGPPSDMLPSITAKPWIDEYRALLAEVKAAGGKPASVLAATPVEATVTAVASAGKQIYYVAAAISVPLLLLLAVKARR